MKKYYLGAGVVIVVLLAAFWGWHSFLRPQSAHVLEAKQRSYGDVIISASRWNFSETETWEFRKNGIIYHIEESELGSANKHISYAQYATLSSSESQQVEELATIAPSSSYYGCPERKPNVNANGIPEATCLGQGGTLRLTIGNCNIYDSCQNFLDLNDQVASSIGSTLTQLLEVKGVHGFGTNMWVSLDAESDLYFYLTAYSPYGFAFGILILLIGIIRRRMLSRQPSGVPAQLPSLFIKVLIIVGYIIAVLCLLLYLYNLIWQPTALRVVS